MNYDLLLQCSRDLQRKGYPYFTPYNAPYIRLLCKRLALIVIRPAVLRVIYTPVPSGTGAQLERGVEHSPGAQRARPPAGQLRGYSGRTKALRASTAPRLVHAPRMTDGGLRLHAHRQAHAHLALRKKSLHGVRYSPQTKACGRAATQGHHGRAQVGGLAPACVRQTPRAAFGV